jgi:cytochrome c-type biogenesis protein CcmE
MATRLFPHRTRRAPKLLIGSLIVVAVVIGLTAWATTRQGSTAFYKTTTEMAAVHDASPSGEYRVNGKVVPGSIRRQGLRATFDITDGKTPMTVTTLAGVTLPDTFKAGANVVADGTFDGHTLTASQVLAKCPSKFKPKSNG